ncbi:MAG: hypothetical protein V3V61_06880, partial [Gammaproteobacteria bacterium]
HASLDEDEKKAATPTSSALPTTPIQSPIVHPPRIYQSPASGNKTTALSLASPTEPSSHLVKDQSSSTSPSSSSAEAATRMQSPQNQSSAASGSVRHSRTIMFRKANNPKLLYIILSTELAKLRIFPKDKCLPLDQNQEEFFKKFFEFISETKTNNKILQLIIAYIENNPNDNLLRPGLLEILKKDHELIYEYLEKEDSSSLLVKIKSLLEATLRKLSISTDKHASSSDSVSPSVSSSSSDSSSAPIREASPRTNSPSSPSSDSSNASSNSSSYSCHHFKPQSTTGNAVKELKASAPIKQTSLEPQPPSRQTMLAQ